MSFSRLMGRRMSTRWALVLVAGVALAGCARGGEPAEEAEEPTADAAAVDPVAYNPIILDDPGRTDDDRYRDDGTKPLELYAFFGVEPGMVVGDLATSRMYNAHILGHIAGEAGKVYAILGLRDSVREGSEERAEQTYADRNVAGGMINVEIIGTLEDIPDDSLDMLITVRNYHDFGERDARLANVPRLLRVLKPGGILGVVDAHTDKTDERDESVHRINEDLAREEIIEGGFEFVDSSDLLYNAEDTFDFDGRRDGDPIHRYYIQRWALKFRKPAG